MEFKLERDAALKNASVVAKRLPAAVARPRELAVQAELRAHGLESLLQRHKLAAKRHSKYNNLVLLKYASNDFNSEVMKECRGIMLDESKDWAVVGCPFFKFMNQDERGADLIEWSRARVYEKLDGSMCMLYFYDGSWRVASSGSPDGSGNIGKQTFEAVFWDIWRNVCKYQEPQDTAMTYTFEMLSPRNQIVCGVNQERIVLIGARRLSDLCEELPEEHAALHGWEGAQSFPLRSIADVLKAASQLNGGDREDGKVPDEEGYVVCDIGNFNRVKVKSPKYVALAHLKGAAVTKVLPDSHLLPLVLADEVDEMSAYFPHLRPRLEELANAITAMAEACVAKSGGTKDIVANAGEVVCNDVSTMRAWLCMPGNVEIKKLLKLLRDRGFLLPSHGSCTMADQRGSSNVPVAKSQSMPKAKSKAKVCDASTSPPQQSGLKGKGKMAPLEKRPAPDGNKYTRDEFIQYFGAKEGADQWEASGSGIGTYPTDADSSLKSCGRRRKR